MATYPVKTATDPIHVEGEIIDNIFGLHRWEGATSWTLTHLQTGFAINSAIPLRITLNPDTLKAAAKRLADALDWNFGLDALDPTLSQRIWDILQD